MIEKLKNMQGITLVALVITIIILIILAGISLDVVLGENGLVSKAKKAKGDVEVAVEDEQDKLNKLYSELKIATNENGQVTLSMSDLNTVIDARIDSKKTEIKSEIYPVGSIYMSMDSTNPSTLFGGTWEQIAQGRTLVGIDTNDTDFNTVEKTGGEKTHTLTVNEMPSHDHSFGIYKGNSNGTNQGPFSSMPTMYSEGSYNNFNKPAKGDGSTNYSSKGNLMIWPTGGSQAHNNVQPYVVTYMWKRTA